MTENLEEVAGKEANIQSDNQIATFKVGEELFGIGISRIREIVRYPNIISVPRAPGFLKGVANLRGNVLPVVDARIRLNLPVTEITDSTRILVIDTGRGSTGVIVDSVRGVISMENASIEPPPSLLNSGVDSKYIVNVIKTGNGDKIIMELNVEALCGVNLDLGMGGSDQMANEQTVSKASGMKELQLVTFLVADEEYAFPIEMVREVLRVGRITEVPDALPYLLGIFCIRDALLPIIDIRKLFGSPSLVEDLTKVLGELEAGQRNWYNNLKESVLSGANFTLELDPSKSEIGKWFEVFRSSSESIDRVMQDMRLQLQKLYTFAAEVNEQVRHSKENAKQIWNDQAHAIETQFFGKFEELISSIGKDIKEDQRILVVEIGSMPVGILVDRMQQVIRVFENIIDPPPNILSTGKTSNLKGIVKLDSGKRLILFLDQDHILSLENLEQLKKMGKDSHSGQKTISDAEKKDTEEIQLVAFKLGKETFSLAIEDVQEINRFDKITAVPRVPAFVEGVMNLRGNVIPAIDLRKRFDMEIKAHDEATRVIIVNISNRLTGLIVDSVSEVLRISKRMLEPPPQSLKMDSKTEFISGIGKLADQKMIILIEASKILSAKEQEQLKF
ncbi:MAG: chemotaxis protein CheW [Candidatus Riflebacteria bacterium]|nr:chemotaxis protein CheW [Candidatus Riflebacteria bacterium]